MTSTSSAAAPRPLPRRRWLSRPPAVVLGWIVAHLFPVAWIVTAGTSTGDIRYYFRGLTGVEDGAMDEYPEVGTWPARLVEVTTSLGGSGTDAENSFVTGFVALSVLVSGVFTWCLWRAGRDTGSWPVWFWILFAGLSGPIFLTRLDIFPGLLVAGFAALLLAGPRWSRPATVLLAVATMMKLWPGVLGAALVGGLRRTATWVRVCWFFASLAVLCVVVVAVGGVDRLLSPLTYQGDRGLQVESVAATPWVLAAALHHLADGAAGDGNPWSISYAASKSYEIAGPGTDATLVVVTALTAASVLTAVVWAVRRLVRDDWTPARAVAFSVALIMLVIVTNKVFSPQYMVWVAPVVAVALVTSRRRVVTVVSLEILVTALLTTTVYPVFYDWLISNPPFPVAAVALVLRNVAVVVLAATCAWWAFRPAGPETRQDPGAVGHGAG
ncbi:glycosyltransferase 87 family protein [Corynebacterium sp.]|uniref:glycosyltransferase 87 family protein n=1 Tax=Corynebacterium sp. TaxID=1720 RepID=UPI0025BC5CF8|nr:glycosyltransferase 87 family protein [Corynebacterium sp.]